MNALANPEVGDYLNKYFVAAFQKVGSFRIVNGVKQGGNVASYFCTANNGVLDALAGPVDAATLLREARWVVETRQLAQLQAGNDLNKYKTAWRLAHAERYEHDTGIGDMNWNRVPLTEPTAVKMASILAAARSLNKQDQIHLLLATYPVVPLNQVYGLIYEKVVGEQLSTLPVDAVGNRPPGTCSPAIAGVCAS